MIDLRKERLSMEEASNPTLEEAIKYLKSMVFTQDMSPSTLRATAVNRMAIEALEKQGKNCDGCIHRGKYENEIDYGYPSPCTMCKRRLSDHYTT